MRHDRKIVAGEEWEHRIDEWLKTAQVILLLISADFLASDYCFGVEMKMALERHERGEAKVIPVIVRPVDWKGSPFSKLQFLPRDGKAVSQWATRDEAYKNITEGIREAIQC